MVKVRVVADAAAGGELLADEMHQLMQRKANAVFGVATGSSPEHAYRALSRTLETSQIDRSQMQAFALDEYVGLDYSLSQSYHHYIQQYVTGPLGFDPQLVHVPEASGVAGDFVLEYDDAIAAAGGIDLQILGIGHNAHIGFNEPGTSFDLPTHIGELHESSRVANSRFFASLDEVPSLTVTQGPATIMRARRIILLAFGEGKAQAVANAVQGPVTEQVPASVLQRHSDVTFIVDSAAASLLKS